MRKFVLPLAAFTLTALWSCGGKGKSGDNNGQKPKDTAASAGVDVKFDRKFDDYARYIAGLPSEKGSSLAAEDNEAFFKEHSQKFSERWKEMDDNRLSKMRAWAKSELHPKIDEQLNTFYPFSGPDFLHCWQFFPQSKKYLFFANESVGEAPELAKMKQADKIAYLKSVEIALGDIFKRSYFITGRMMRDIPKLKGAIPIFMVFLARTEHEIINIELIQINPDGKTTVRNGRAIGGVEGVRFTFRPRSKKGDIRTLEYFNTDISDDGVKKRPEVIAYIEAFGKANTFVKSASYLMHYNTFSKIREAVLKINASVLEDDTGIPYRFFNGQGYDVHLYGVYVKPVNEFKGVEQKDLAKAFSESGKVKPLPFSLGYHWYTKDQNYMLYIKK